MSSEKIRLDNVERRLSQIEEKLGLPGTTTAEPREAALDWAPTETTSAPVHKTAPLAPDPDDLPTVGSEASAESEPALIEASEIVVLSKPEKAVPPPTQLAPWQSGPSFATAAKAPEVSMAMFMAIGACISFLLAAAYFISLIYSTGWLTPPRQVAIAAVAGIGFIVAGILFSQRDRRYASYLPAVGLAILYLATGAAYTSYELLNFSMMTASIAIISVIALAIDRFFDQAIYSLIAIVAVYITPLLAGPGTNLLTYIVYFSAWCMLFSFMSLQLKRRFVYMAAMSLAVISFDYAWRQVGNAEWKFAFAFHSAQFLVFGMTAAAFTLIHKKKLSDLETVIHGLPLFFFYISQFILLKQNSAQWVPVFGLFCVGLVLAFYIAGRSKLDKSEKSAASWLVSLFVSAVTAHIVFFEVLPVAYLPWSVLLFPFVVIVVHAKMGLDTPAMIPVMLVATLLMIFGLALAFLPREITNTEVIGLDIILLVYAAVLYLTYFVFVRDTKMTNLTPGVLYAAHVSLLVGVLRIVNDQVLISIVWALLAVALLLAAIRLGDRILGQSSLLIFAASGLKVVLFDLAGSPGLVRIATLVVLGASLYAGGWLYQRLLRKTRVFHSNPEINKQLRQIAELVQTGLTNQQINKKLEVEKTPCLAEGGWTAELIQTIRSTYHMES